MRTLALILTSFLALGGTRLEAQTCRPADAYGTNMVTDLRRMVTSTDPRIMGARDSIYHMPLVAPSEITLVTDERICQKALRALEHFEKFSSHGPVLAATTANSTTASTTVARQVVVASLGSGNGWAVEDPGSSQGAFLTVVIFDDHGKQVGGYTGP